MKRVATLLIAAVCFLTGCDSATQGQPARADHRYDKQATNNIRTALHLNFNESMYESAKIRGNTCTVVVQRSKYDEADASGQETMQNLLKNACAASYRYISSHRRAIPDDGLKVVLNDRAGSELFSDTVMPSDADSGPSPKPKKAALKVAYTIVDHYIWDCSSNGGFGEKAIVNSHKETDLNAVVKEWMAENATDKSLCLHFEAFATQESYNASQHPSQYTDAELANIPTGVTYTNNPNTHYEAWTDTNGDEHLLRDPE